MYRSLKLFALTTFLAFLLTSQLTSCASSVQHSVSDYQYQGEKFRAVTVTVTPELEHGLRDTDFNTDTMTKSIIHQLRKQQLWDETTGSSLQVHVDDVRIRSLMTALIFAFFAGDDHIKGDVTIFDPAQNPQHTFRVSTSFAMGGLFNTQGDVRWEWLYQAFAEQITLGIVQGANKRL